MNERLNELTELFLYRGCTPEQEKELFEACLHNPQMAEALRQQLLLSLKIRQLRDRAEVPADVRNELFRKINLIAAENTARDERKPALLWLRNIRLGWSHAAIAAASAAAALVLYLNIGRTPVPEDFPATAYTTFRDTVRIVDTKTVVTVKERKVPVYIERSPLAENEYNPFIKEMVRPVSISDVDTEALMAYNEHETGASWNISPLRTMEVQNSDFMVQYARMVSTVEIIELTSEDRVKY